MSGFNINMQNTALTTLSGFTSTGWTNVYTGTYTVPGTGWQYIDLQTPFAWNGTSNIMVEVCFGNTLIQLQQQFLELLQQVWNILNITIFPLPVQHLTLRQHKQQEQIHVLHLVW